MDSCFNYSGLKICFNNKLYNLCVIEESLGAFGDFFESKIEIEENHIVVELNLIDNKGDIFIVREFCNYALGLMQNNR